MAAAKREINIMIAKLALEAKRYEDVVHHMVVKNAFRAHPLTLEEGKLLAAGITGKLETLKTSQVLLKEAFKHNVEKEAFKHNVEKEAVLNYYKEAESDINESIMDHCTMFVGYLVSVNHRELPPEDNAFYQKLKGDLYKLSAEVSTGEDRVSAIEKALEAYEVAKIKVNKANLQPAHPLVLELEESRAVFYADISKDPAKAFEIGQAACNAATGGVSAGKFFCESVPILERLDAKMMQWET